MKPSKKCVVCSEFQLTVIESEETIMTGACQPAKAEYTPKEYAALEKAISNMRIRNGFAPGYET